MKIKRSHIKKIIKEEVGRSRSLSAIRQVILEEISMDEGLFDKIFGDGGKRKDRRKRGQGGGRRQKIFKEYGIDKKLGRKIENIWDDYQNKAKGSELSPSDASAMFVDATKRIGNRRGKHDASTLLGRRRFR